MNKGDIVKSYMWLVAGCFSLWLGLKALYYSYAFDVPQGLTMFLIVAPVCFYEFVANRRRAHSRATRHPS